MNDQLTVIAQVRAKRGQEARVREILHGLVKPTCAERGCIDYVLHQSQDDPTKFVFYENWVSAGHLDAHAKSSHIEASRKLLPQFIEGKVEITIWKKVPA
ncbi:MAG TPA: putative quinol monooxygenase [Candidatus Acidoferrales bacterium]|nr:putative quinol monooxygenase [Candidatus Acidoferrales bacterium]